MESPEDFTGPVNLGNPEEITISTLAEKIARMTASSAGIAHRPAPADDPRQRCPDIGLAREKLAWHPGTPLDSGLKPTIEHFRGVIGRQGEGASPKGDRPC